MFNHTMDRLQYIKQIIYIISTLSLKSSLYKQKKFIFFRKGLPSFYRKQHKFGTESNVLGFPTLQLLGTERGWQEHPNLTPQTETY
jgi:hypothetical protein